MRDIKLTDVKCNDNEVILDMCQKTILSPTESAAQYDSVEVAGVNCRPIATSTSIVVQSSKEEPQSTVPSYIAIGFLVLFLLLATAIIAGYVELNNYFHDCFLL